jgi:hypothetical protein
MYDPRPPLLSVRIPSIVRHRCVLLVRYNLLSRRRISSSSKRRRRSRSSNLDACALVVESC